MEKHPLTPMTDADIRRWLRRQTQGDVGHVPLDAVRGGPALAAAFAAEARAGAASWWPMPSATPTCWRSAQPSPATGW